MENKGKEILIKKLFDRSISLEKNHNDKLTLKDFIILEENFESLK
jgi:hypothetical protein